MRVTIYDVAEKANVSIATVSKVINNKGYISKKTREKVKRVMNELDYRPNIMASALMGKQTKTIGLLIPDLSNPFFSELARSIELRGHDLGYNLFICNTDYKIEKENKYIDLLKQKSVDGYILASGFEKTDKIEELIKEKKPVVVVARDFSVFPVNAVALDDFMGGEIAARHLLEQGHKNIGVIARDLWSNRERLRGFKHVLKENDLSLHPTFRYIEGIDHLLLGSKMAGEYLTSDNPPTAIFACNDLLAAGVLQKARQLGVNIPKDLSLVGFDDTSIASIIEPPLTTIAQPIENMGREVMDTIVAIIKGEKKDISRITMMPSLIKRETVQKI